TYWVLVVMDQFTRRIVGFAVHRGVVDGLALCRMFNRAIQTQAFWTAADLEEKLRAFQNSFNKHRVHSGLKGQLPDPEDAGAPLNFASYEWQQHCCGLYQTTIGA